MSEEIVMPATERELQLALADQYVNEVLDIQKDLEQGIARTEEAVKILREKLNVAELNLRIQRGQKGVIDAVETRMNQLKKNYEQTNSSGPEAGTSVQPPSGAERR